MEIPVLDHGYVKFVEAWGKGIKGLLDSHVPRGMVLPNEDFERGIIEAARQSTQGTFRSWDTPDENGRTDQKLLEFLYTKNHSTPFEFAGMVLEIQAPIMVFREWHRHRTQSYNEMSARYAPLPDLNYLPSTERLLMGSNQTNKQAGAMDGAPTLTPLGADLFRQAARVVYEVAEERYQAALSAGVPKELARLVIPVGRYSRMRVSANLRNWLAFLTLRDDPAAQWEIQQYAKVVARLVGSLFPRTYRIHRKKRQQEAGPPVMKPISTEEAAALLKPGTIVEVESEGGEA